ncbi:hypothetical protein RI129_000427 [Pyrocoelia pectoralis]|uniref:Uncharacterized protein n=1 Tax=Pyrocoelia pectoralis TaxID=417401 RepID=A0AAN7VSS9_9COLE
MKEEMKTGQEEIIRSQEKNLEQLRNEIKTQKQECEKKFRVHERKIEDLHQQNVGFTQQVDYEFRKMEHKITKHEKITDQKLTELDNKVEKYSEEVETIKEEIRGEARFTKAKIHKIMVRPESELYQRPKKFDGNLRNGHPINFIKAVENYLKNFEITDQERVNIVMELLEGNAKSWSQLRSREWRNINEFKEDFMKQFWSEQNQDKIKLRLATPKLYDSRRGNYVDHVWYWVGETAHIQPPLREEQLVHALTRHFPQEVENILIGSGEKTVQNLVNMLERIQEANPNFRRNVQGTRNSENQDRRDYRQNQERRQVNVVEYGRGRNEQNPSGWRYPNRRYYEERGPQRRRNEDNVQGNE